MLTLLERRHYVPMEFVIQKVPTLHSRGSHLLYWVAKVLEVKVRVYEGVADLSSGENCVHVGGATGHTPNVQAVLLTCRT